MRRAFERYVPLGMLVVVIAFGAWCATLLLEAIKHGAR